MLGDGWFAAVHPEDREKLSAGWKESAHTHKASLAEYRFARPNGSIAWVYGQAVPEKNVEDQTVGYVGTITDITERKRAEDALRLSDSILQHVGNLVLVADSNGAITFASASAKSLLGYDPAALLDNGWWMVSRANDEEREAAREHVCKAARGEIALQEESYYETQVRHTNGEMRTLLWHDAAGPGVSLIGVGIDITERKKAEKALRESEAKYRSLVDTADDIIFEIEPDGTISSLNPAFENLLSLPAEEWIGKPFTPVIHPDDLPLALDLFRRALQGETLSVFELRVRTKQPNYLNFEFSTNPRWHNGAVASVGGIARDITERKQTEVELRKLSKAVRNSGDVIFMTDSDGTITFINPEFTRMYGYEGEEVVGKTTPRILKSGTITKNEYEQFWNAILSKQSLSSEYVNKTKDGRQIDVEGSVDPILDDHDEIIGFLSIQRDITERKRAEEALRESLQEKEILLKEIHHRVKNNMQVISSLLSLQSYSVTDERFLRLLKESQNRVKSMAMIHERLYRSGNFSSINFTDYIRELVASLVRSYSVRGNIAVSVSGEPVSLSVETAIPCGLIINELVSNALKYAFPNGGTGEITIDLKTQEPNWFLLEVSDNGVGIGSDIDPLTLNSLGLRLVRILTNQIRGEMDMDRTSGTRFSFSIPV